MEEQDTESSPSLKNCMKHNQRVFCPYFVVFFLSFQFSLQLNRERGELRREGGRKKEMMKWEKTLIYEGGVRGITRR